MQFQEQQSFFKINLKGQNTREEKSCYSDPSFTAMFPYRFHTEIVNEMDSKSHPPMFPLSDHESSPKSPMPSNSLPNPRVNLGRII